MLATIVVANVYQQLIRRIEFEDWGVATFVKFNFFEKVLEALTVTCQKKNIY